MEYGSHNGNLFSKACLNIGNRQKGEFQNGFQENKAR